MFLKIVFVTHLFYTMLNGESLEEMSPFMYSNAGSSVNFNDIFPYTSGHVGGDPHSPDIKEDVYNIHIIPSQLVEFSTTITPEYLTTSPPLPKYAHNLNLIRNNKMIKSISPYNKLTTGLDAATKKDNIYHTILDRSYRPQVPVANEKLDVKRKIETTTQASTTTTTTTTTTTKISTEAPRRERGILDLLFPQKRVKSFKNMFDTVKSILSYTFKR